MCCIFTKQLEKGFAIRTQKRLAVSLIISGIWYRAHILFVSSNLSFNWFSLPHLSEFSIAMQYFHLFKFLTVQHRHTIWYRKIFRTICGAVFSALYLGPLGSIRAQYMDVRHRVKSIGNFLLQCIKMTIAGKCRTAKEFQLTICVIALWKYAPKDKTLDGTRSVLFQAHSFSGTATHTHAHTYYESLLFNINRNIQSGNSKAPYITP